MSRDWKKWHPLSAALSTAGTLLALGAVALGAVAAPTSAEQATSRCDPIASGDRGGSTRPPGGESGGADPDTAPGPLGRAQGCQERSQCTPAEHSPDTPSSTGTTHESKPRPPETWRAFSDTDRGSESQAERSRPEQVPDQPGERPTETPTGCADEDGESLSRSDERPEPGDPGAAGTTRERGTAGDSRKGWSVETASKPQDHKPQERSGSKRSERSSTTSDDSEGGDSDGGETTRDSMSAGKRSGAGQYEPERAPEAGGGSGSGSGSGSSGNSGSDDDPGGGLPNTGFAVGTLALAGLALLIGGALTRRRLPSRDR